MPSGEYGWNVRSTFELDGVEKTIPHFFPDVCFPGRAAEYGIDPADVDTLLDVILNEVFIDPREIDHDTTIYGAASMAETRKAHTARCARVKLRHRLSTRRNTSTLKARAANPSDPLTAAEAEQPHPLQNLWDHFGENPIPREHVQECEAIIRRARTDMGLPHKSEE